MHFPIPDHVLSDGRTASPVTGLRRHALLTAASRSLEERDVAEALDRVEFASALDPADSVLQLAAANLWVRSGQPAAAVDRYDSILRRSPDRHDARLSRAVNAALLGDATSARDDWRYLADHAAGFARRWKSFLRHAHEAVGELRDEPAPQTGQRHGIVVLGHELNEDGTIRPELAERLEVVARLWRSDPDDDVIVSGGMVRGGAVEAPLMRAWLIRAGVDRDRIILEPHSFDTLENATLSTSVAVRAGIHSLTLVTSDYHMARASALFEAARELVAGRHHHPPRVVRRRSARLPAETTTGERSAVRDIAAERDLLRLGGIWTIPGYFR